ncbi:thiol reductant ABC exporter subunit CydC [Kribbella deserti]|uniref:Thiol reductant ABC exporter subunit CydC n=1 Tax=Kribbella deserti TaxID=1926257 RepID=A0ABV6QUW9_9ACTN
MKSLVGAVVAGVLASGSAVALLATSAWLITTAAAQPPVLTLLVAIVAVRAFGVARGVFRYVERLAGHDAAYRLLGDARSRMTARLEERGLQHLRRGDLLARLVLDVDAVLDLWLRVVLPLLVAAITATATVVLVVLLLPTAGLAVALAVLVACTVVPWLTARAARQAEKAVASDRGEAYALATATLQAAPDLIAYDGVSRALDEFAQADARLAWAERRSAWSAGLGNALLVVCVGAASLSGLILGSAGEVSGPVFAVLVLTPLALADVLGGVPLAAQMAIRVRASLKRVEALAEAPTPVGEPLAPVALPSGRDLVVAGVAAGYGDGPDVLTDVDLELAEGARVVLTGPSGSGKSTLAGVLLRFLDPRAGRITLGGVDVSTLAGDDVRTVVGLMTQESHIFDTSIEENLRIAKPDATVDELMEALDRAKLGDFVRGLSKGLQTMVGEHGARLSGGERQRLAMARLLLADFDILVLDEPTEHLDTDTGQALLYDLYAAAGQRSILLLTHHPEQAPYADQLVDLS